MIKQISAIYKESDCGGLKSIIFSIILGMIVFFADMKRFVYCTLPRIGKFQSTIFYGIIYIFMAPVAYAFFFIAGEHSKASKDKSISIDSFNSLPSDNGRMY